MREGRRWTGDVRGVECSRLRFIGAAVCVHWNCIECRRHGDGCFKLSGLLDVDGSGHVRVRIEGTDARSHLASISRISGLSCRCWRGVTGH